MNSHYHFVRYFNKDTKKSIVLQVKMQKTTVFSQLSAALRIIVQLKMCHIGPPNRFATATRHLFHCKIVFFISLIIDLVLIVSNCFLKFM